MATVLVTRPLEAAERTAATARALGHDVLLAPVVAIVPIAGPPPGFDDVQAVLVTSRQAVPAVAAWPGLPPVWAVGAGTAAALQACCVPVVDTGDGDGAALGRRLAARLKPEAGVLLHASGETIASGLQRALTAAGFRYRSHPVYRTARTEALPPDVRSALGAGRVDAVTLHSPASAEAFADLVRRHGLVEAVAGLTALCLSSNVAVAAGALPWRRIVVAAAPDEPAMGRLLEAVAL